MSLALRILGATRFDTGPRAFRPAEAPTERPAPPERIEGDLLRHVLEHGALLYEVDLDAEAAALVPGEDDLMAFGVTYGEWWAEHPEEREVKPPPRWEPRLLLILDAAHAQLRRGAEVLPLDPQPVYAPELGRCVFAVTLLPSTPAEGAASAVCGAVRPLAEGERRGWQVGDAVIEVAPYPPGVLRFWDWAWSRTAGPVYFWVFLHRTDEELRAWFERLPPRRFAVRHETLWPCAADGPPVSRCFERVAPQIYHFKGEPAGTRDLYLLPGSLRLLHGVGEKPGQAEADATLLAAVLAGELGEVRGWMLIDGDYDVCQACGRGAESLRAYLDPNEDAARLRAAWARHERTVDLRGLHDDESVARALGAALGAPAGLAALDALAGWLAQATEAALPCAIWLRYERGADVTLLEEAMLRLSRARGGILWKLWPG